MIKTFDTRHDEEQQQDISARSISSQRSPLFDDPDIPAPYSSSRPSFGLDREVISGSREMDLNSIGGGGGSGRGGGKSGGGGSRGGNVGGRSASPPASSSSGANTTAPLDSAAAKARRRIDREAKLPQMEDAVAVASGDARHMMDQHRSGHLATTNMIFTDVTIEEEGAASGGGKEGRGRKLMGLLGGTCGPSSSSQQQGQQQPSVSVGERIKNILPSSWDRANNASSNGNGIVVDPSAFPDGSSLSTRSLTTTGRNLHDIGTAVVVPASSRWQLW